MLPLVLSLIWSASVAVAGPAVQLVGSVVDAEGKPVAAATIVVAEGPSAVQFVGRTSRVHVLEPLDALATTVSDRSGKFTLPLLDEAAEVPWRRSRFTVWAQHSDFALSVRLVDRDWPRAGLPFNVALPKTASVKVKIVDAAYRPVAGARVIPFRIAGHYVPVQIADRMATTTDARGLAMLAGIRQVDLEAMRVETQSLGVQWLGVSNRDRNPINLVTLAPVGRLSGRLIADDPRAVRRRRLRFATWQIPGDDRAGGGLAEVVTDDAGAFDVPALAAGNLTFDLEVGGDPVHLCPQSNGPQIDPDETTTFEIPLRRAVRVIQEVRDRDDDRPIAGARVSLFRGLLAGVHGDTDRSGRVELDVLHDELRPRLVRIPAPYYDPGGASPRQEISPDAESVLFEIMRLPRGTSINGCVVDEHGQRVSGAEVVGFWKSPNNTAHLVRGWSNADGEFTIDGIPSQTQVMLWTNHANGASVEPVLSFPGGERVTLTIDGKSNVSLEGRVVDAGGQPVAGAFVRIWAEQRVSVGRTEDATSLLFDGDDRLATDAQGAFRTPHSLRPDARYSLEVEAPGMLSSQTEAVEPREWQTSHFADVVLRAAPRLRVVTGRVVDRQGRAVAGATVRQSGDGPRRTKTTTDEGGNFRIGGVYDDPAILVAQKDGFRIHTARVAPTDKTCDLVLAGSGDAATPMHALPALLSPEELRTLVMSLIEPSFSMLRDAVQTAAHRDLLTTIAQVEPATALEMLETVKPGLFRQIAKETAALALVASDLDEARSVIAGLDTPDHRAHLNLRVVELLSDAPTKRNILLEEALRQARAEPDAGFKANLLGQIAVRWLRLGDRDRGTKLMREGHALAESLPAPTANNQRDLSTRQRVRFAGWLAHVDGEAAIRLLDGFNDQPNCDRYRTDVAAALATHDPTAAERILQTIASADGHARATWRVVGRMAAAEPRRALRLAREVSDPSDRAFALGHVACVLAAADRTESERVLEEAYQTLEHASQLGPASFGWTRTALTAAALVRLAEGVDPALVEDCLCRAIALREPRSGVGDATWNRASALGPLAALMARYDRGLARDLIAPLAHRLREALAEGSGNSYLTARLVLMAMAATDPRWAAELVQALPDGPQPLTSPRQIAARILAAWLAMPPRDFWDRVHSYCNLSDPDARDDIP
ncbi:MAG TPA: carboxypeptidase-like regulatory domain-containing protein [Pirellulales bacterium]|nr:carboxypeptidase-like regulatory domain-containing protein [Pirellulales bacterium]